MDFRLDEDLQRFQREVNDFIATGLPAGWDDPSLDFEAGLAVERQVMTSLAQKHWLALPWPEEYGGLGATPLQQMVFNESIEYNRVHGSIKFVFAWEAPVVML